jgi:hypothetical protein
MDKLKWRKRCFQIGWLKEQIQERIRDAGCGDQLRAVARGESNESG